MLALLVSLSVACAVTNIILINEYPDYQADKEADKQNLLVRIGKENTAFIYSLLVVCAGASFFLALSQGLPIASVFFYSPVLIVALILASLMLKAAYSDKLLLQRMCAMTILVNLGTSLSCIFGLLINKV